MMSLTFFTNGWLYLSKKLFMMKKLLIPAVLFSLSACTGTKEKNQVKNYRAGFKTIHGVDRSRVYKTGSDTANYLHYRPIDIDVWYPADSGASDTALLFRNILGLFDQRANYYTASTAGDGLSQQVAQLFCTGFNCSDTTKLLNFRTRSFPGASVAKGKFPLVIYLSAFNGMSYENYSLFEDLAARGFVVISISSIGRYPGDMTMKYEDLVEQVNDGIAAYSQLKDDQGIDFSRVGLIGYSWGGMAAPLLAGKLPGVDCIVSLDGSEFHRYGQAPQEDKDFDGILNSDDFRNLALPIPYLRLESPVAAAGAQYNFSEKISGSKQVFTIDSAQHEDFGCLSLIVRESGNCKKNGRYETVSKLTIAFLQEHLGGSPAFSKAVKEEQGKTITKKQ